MLHHVLTQLLVLLSDTTGSVAAAIVVATIVVRAALLPLSLRAYRAEKIRARLAPQLAALRERHGKDPVALAERSAALMRAEGSGPLAGLLPMLAQAPFIWVLYRGFTGDAVRGHTLLGADLTARLLDHPALGAGWLIVAALAAIAGWNARQVPAGAPGFARALPFGTVVFAAFTPVAAGIYLVTSGLWTAVERAVFRR